MHIVRQFVIQCKVQAVLQNHIYPYFLANDSSNLVVLILITHPFHRVQISINVPLGRQFHILLWHIQIPFQAQSEYCLLYFLKLTYLKDNQ